MAKKKCWFGWVNRLFISEAKTKAAEKKSKRWRWVFGRLKFKQYPALTAPQRTLNEATEEQRKHALTVAIATAAAAEAAVAAAHAAAEVVRLTVPAQSYHQWTKRDRNLAAIKIQSAFRAYLARKALRALKGLVRLQAIVRGRAVRRQTITKLKFLSSSVKMQPKVWERGIPAADGICKDGEKIECVEPKEDQEEKEIKLECNSQRRWNCSVLSKEDLEAIWIRRQEAIIKRERMMKYSYSHRERRDTHMLEETVQNKESGRLICRLQQWADTEAYNRERLEILKPTVNPNLTTGDIHGPAQVKQRNMLKDDRLTLPFSFPRRSFSRVQHDTAGDDSSIPNSPAYMAATQSAKAKARSMSTPKQRVGFLETYFDHSLPHRNGLSFWSSYNGEPISSNGNSGASQQISASMSHHY